MAGTYTELLYHIVFSTKERYPLISRDWQDRLHQYLGGILHTLGGYPEQIGGMADHVHLLGRLKPTHCISDVLCRLKKGSSEWIHDQLGIGDFAWQTGYGAFTVSPWDLEKIRRYIAEQEKHHRRKSFQEEFREFLELAGIAFDERYLW